MTDTKVCSYDKMNCLRAEGVSPLKHQKQMCKFLVNDKNRGIILFHSVGSGKTLTSLFSAKCILEKYPEKRVVITTGTSLVENFENEMKKLKLTKDPRYTVISYGKLVNQLKKGVNKMCSNTILVVDEAHNFGRKGVNSEYLLRCARKAFKVILLTATPVSNTPKEIIKLLNMINYIPQSERKISEILEDNSIGDAITKSFKRLFECKVSVYKTPRDSEAFPTSKEHEITLEMTPEYYAEYYKIQEDVKDDLPEIFSKTRNLAVFLNGVRRAVNSVKVVSPKITWTIEKIVNDINNGKKIMIYSAWKQAGVNIIKKLLALKGIKYSEVTGDLTKEQRGKYVKNYNTGKTMVMLVTAAGAEGLDLKGTRSIIILEPHWNSSRTNQIIGRGIRYGSHAHLPKSERHVDVYYTILKKPSRRHRFLTDSIPTADEILKDISDVKNTEIMNFYKKLDKLSIESNKNC